MIVIDASALVKYILHEEHWEDISKFIREKRPLYSVDHIAKEVCNALWKHYIRGIVSKDIVFKLMKAFMKLVQTEVIILEPEYRYLYTALEIAIEHKLPLYDTLYVAQAKHYGELLTSDKEQAEVAKELGIEVYLVT